MARAEWRDMTPEAVLALIDALASHKITPEQARAYVKAGMTADQIRTVVAAEKPYHGPG